MDWDTWTLYAAATLLLSLTPGPSGLLALTHGGLYGARRTLFTACGGVAGFSMLIALSMSGLGAILAASDAAFEAVRLLGALYLVWLGVRTWRSPPLRPEARAGAGRPRRASGLFAEGFLVALSNPKVILFFAAFLPQFLDPARSLAGQFAVMAATFALVELGVEMVLAAGSERILPWLSRDANARRFRRLTGGLFVGAGAALAVLGR